MDLERARMDTKERPRARLRVGGKDCECVVVINTKQRRYIVLGIGENLKNIYLGGLAWGGCRLSRFVRVSAVANLDHFRWLPEKPGYRFILWMEYRPQLVEHTVVVS